MAPARAVAGLWYYLTFSEESGYNQSVVLADGVILTVAARNDEEPLTAIRWRPVETDSQETDVQPE